MAPPKMKYFSKFAQALLGTWWAATTMERSLPELPTRLGPWQCSTNLLQGISTTHVSFKLKHCNVRLFAMVVKVMRQHFFALRLVGLSVSAFMPRCSQALFFLFAVSEHFLGPVAKSFVRRLRCLDENEASITYLPSSKFINMRKYTYVYISSTHFPPLHTTFSNDSR